MLSALAAAFLSSARQNTRLPVPSSSVGLGVQRQSGCSNAVQLRRDHIQHVIVDPEKDDLLTDPMARSDTSPTIPSTTDCMWLGPSPPFRLLVTSGPDSPLLEA
jgi:hypothetical protein